MVDLGKLGPVCIECGKSPHSERPHYAVETPATPVQAGDFMLVHGTDFIDRLISLGTRSKWTHAALVIDEQGTIVEATSGGVHYANISKYAGYDHLLVRVPLSDEDRTEVHDFAVAMAEQHEKYGFLTIAAIVLKLITRLRLVLKVDGTFICSEFVARALGQGGVIWERDPALMAPVDLARIAQACGLVVEEVNHD
jgi:uncharacterized protein YycO